MDDRIFWALKQVSDTHHVVTMATRTTMKFILTYFLKAFKHFYVVFQVAIIALEFSLKRG